MNPSILKYWSKPTRIKLDVRPARKVLRNLYLKSMRERVDHWERSKDFKGDVDGRKITAEILRAGFRDFRIALQGGRCCYCRGELIGSLGGRPVEHVLPRVHYPQFSLCFWNLAVSCARCNGIKKGEDWIRSWDKSSRRYPRRSDASEFFHPVYDEHSDHIWMRRVSDGQTSVAVFVGLTDKGRHLCRAVLNEVSKVETRVAGNPDLAKSLEIIDAVTTSVSHPAGPDYLRFQALLKDCLDSA